MSNWSHLIADAYLHLLHEKKLIRVGGDGMVVVDEDEWNMNFHRAIAAFILANDHMHAAVSVGTSHIAQLLHATAYGGTMLQRHRSEVMYEMCSSLWEANEMSRPVLGSSDEQFMTRRQLIDVHVHARYIQESSSICYLGPQNGRHRRIGWKWEDRMIRVLAHELQVRQLIEAATLFNSPLSKEIKVKSILIKKLKGGDKTNMLALIASFVNPLLRFY